MRSIIEYGAATHTVRTNRDSGQLFPVTGRYRAFPRWYHIIVAAAAIAAVITILPGQHSKSVAQLEQLASKIERASTLSADARQAIGRILVEQNASLGLSATQDARRKAAIERIAAAIETKQSAGSATRLITSHSAHAGD